MSKRRIIIAAAVIVLIVAVIGVLAVLDVKRQELPQENKPKEENIDPKTKDGKDLVPVKETEEHGNVAEATPEDTALPTEDELGEYQEVFMSGDIINDNTKGGWVVAVSLDDITINTYNTLTTYYLAGSAKKTAPQLKPGDAVMVEYSEAEDGTSVAYYLGRVRIEDEPLTQEEIEKMYKEAELNE